MILRDAHEIDRGLSVSSPWKQGRNQSAFAECVSVLNKEIDLTYWDETESRYWWVDFQTNGSAKLLGAGVSTPNRIDKPRPTIMA